jgi:hypothetical protein
MPPPVASLAPPSRPLRLPSPCGPDVEGSCPRARPSVQTSRPRRKPGAWLRPLCHHAIDAPPFRRLALVHPLRHTHIPILGESFSHHEERRVLPRQWPNQHPTAAAGVSQTSGVFGVFELSRPLPTVSIWAFLEISTSTWFERRDEKLFVPQSFRTVRSSGEAR